MFVGIHVSYQSLVPRASPHPFEEPERDSLARLSLPADLRALLQPSSVVALNWIALSFLGLFEASMPWLLIQSINFHDSDRNMYTEIIL